MSLCSFICICTLGSNSYLCFMVFGIWSWCVKKNIISADISLLTASGTNCFGCILNFELLHALIYQTNTDCSDKINICSEIVRFWEANFHKYINSLYSVFQLPAFSFNSVAIFAQSVLILALLCTVLDVFKSCVLWVLSCYLKLPGSILWLNWQVSVHHISNGCFEEVPGPTWT